MKPFKYEIQKKKWDKLRRRRLITSIAIGGCSALVFTGAGVGVGYVVWHTNKILDEIKPRLSFTKGGNNELSSTVDSNEKNTITLNASFNQDVWWAGIYLTSGCEDIFEDNYVSYSNDGGATWLSSSTAYDGGVYFWFENYRSSGSIIFKLLKSYTDDKLVNFILTYCPKEHEPLIESDEIAPVLFLQNTPSNSEIIRHISFRLFDGTSYIGKSDFLSDLNTELGGLFISSPLPFTPENGKNAAKLLCESINQGGISDAASIVALIACENWIILSRLYPSTITHLNGLTFDLEISFVYKNNANDYFDYDFTQHWRKSDGSEVNMGYSRGNQGEWIPGEYDEVTNLANNRYIGTDEKFTNSSTNVIDPIFENTYLTADSAINNFTGNISTDQNRTARLDLITQDLAKTIYKGVNDFPLWMFPNS